MAIAIAANNVRQLKNCESIGKNKKLEIRNWGLEIGYEKTVSLCKTQLKPNSSNADERIATQR